MLCSVISVAGELRTAASRPPLPACLASASTSAHFGTAPAFTVSPSAWCAITRGTALGARRQTSYQRPLEIS